MRTKLLFASAVAFVAAISLGHAQIPNNGFEQWSLNGNDLQPDGWATSLGGQPGPYLPVSRSTDHYPSSEGMYSIRLENDPTFIPVRGGYGMAITGGFDYPFEPAFPVSGNPTNLYGYYKYNSVNQDTAMIKVVLFNNGVVVNDDAFVITSSTAEWTSFNVQFHSYTAADSATILISAFFPSGMDDGPNGNSVLYVDNLSFDGLISSVKDPQDVSELNVYPNPAVNTVTVVNDVPTMKNRSVQIHSLTGVLVRALPMMADKQNVDVSGLANGTYIVTVFDDRTIARTRIVVQR